MDPAWSALVFVLAAAAVGWFWHDSLAAKERANAAAQEVCQRLGLQFLDGTVAFARIALTRGRSGSLTLRRTYVFDYTADSIERRQGFLILLATQVESVGLAPGDEARGAPPALVSVESPSVSAPPATRPSAEVFSIEDWRRKRQHRLPRPRADDVDDARR